MLKNKDELKDRYEAKKKSLSARLAELKADGRHEAIEARSKIEQKLKEAEEWLKDGWEKMSEPTAAKMNAWLDDRDDRR
jgi:hypothetical protein